MHRNAHPTLKTVAVASVLVASTIASAIAQVPTRYTWEGRGPGVGGWITAIAIAADGDVYVATDIGGIWRSHDEGGSWAAINNGLADYAIDTIAIHPADPETLLLGTWSGIHRSVDGGESWSLERGGFPATEDFSFSAPVAAIAFDPQSPDTVFAGIGRARNDDLGQGTVYQSVDGGKNWSVVNTGTPNFPTDALIYDLAVHPTDRSVVFASSSRGFFVSEDGGISWTEKSQGLPHLDARYFDVHPNDPNTLYLTVHTPPGIEPWEGGVFVTSDRGESWTQRANGLEKQVGPPGGAYEQTTNYDHVAIDPAKPERLYVGSVSWWGDGVFRSDDGGESWVNTRDNVVEGGWAPNGMLAQALAVDPVRENTVYIGGSAEILKTTDGGDSWRQTFADQVTPGRWSSRGIDVTVVNAIAFDPTDAHRVYLGIHDFGLLQSEDGGISFSMTTHETFPYAEVRDIELDPRDASRLFAAVGEQGVAEGGILQSSDFGLTWTLIDASSGLPETGVYALAAAADGDRLELYAGVQDEGVYRSSDDGLTWTGVNNGLDGGSAHVTSLWVDPADPLRVLAGVERETGSIHGGVYLTPDGGATWQQLDGDPKIPFVYDVAGDPTDPDRIFVSARNLWDPETSTLHEGGIYRSLDGGQSWDRVFADRFARSVLIDPHDRERVYAATTDHQFHDLAVASGVWISRDGGDNWEPHNRGLQMPNVNVLAADPSRRNRLWLGTGGGGAYRLTDAPILGSDIALSPDASPDPESQREPRR